MRRIAERAALLEMMSESYAPFARHLRDLAAGWTSRPSCLLESALHVQRTS